MCERERGRGRGREREREREGEGERVGWTSQMIQSFLAVRSEREKNRSDDQSRLTRE